jgi:predicted glutamine amidotransferase
MCELFAMSCREPAALTISLDELARHGGGPGRHRDGWGIAFYEDRDAHVVREAAAAHDSPWVRCLREHALYSRLVVAHIRKATIGARTLANTQPFARELGGRRHVFAHNGHLPSIAADPRFGLGSFRPVGGTDSELAFCALLSRLEPLWRGFDAAPSASDRYAILASFAGDLRSLGPANFLYSDGELLAAHADRRVQDDGRIAPPGLWMLERECPAAGVDTAASGVTVDAATQRVVLIASVPLSREAWRPLSAGELLVLKDTQIVRSSDQRPLTASAGLEAHLFG